jgi:predicted house-cleaning noncanonical NTP pyrophosphatase (MazG superfamily)
MSFAVKGATWLPKYVRDRLLNSSADGHMTKSGQVLRVTSSESRSQHQNYNNCADKIFEEVRRVIDAIPKETSAEKIERVKRLAKADNENRLEQKKQKSMKKSSRKLSKSDFLQ